MEIKKFKDIDPYGEEEWDNEIKGQCFYYLSYDHVDTPHIENVFCMGLNNDGYYHFSRENQYVPQNLRFPVFFIPKKSLRIINDDNDVKDYAIELKKHEKIVCLVPKEKKALFLITFDTLFKSHKKRVIHACKTRIAREQKTIKWMNSMDTESYLKKIGERGGFQL